MSVAAAVVAVLVAIIGSSALGATVQGWLQRRRTSSEATNIIADAAAKVVATISTENARLVVRVDRMEADLAELRSQLTQSDNEQERLRARVEELHAHIDTLEALMTASGVTPPPRPRLHEA